MIKLGNNNIGSVYLGDNSIGTIYKGSDLVFQKVVPIVYVKSTDGIFYYNIYNKNNTNYGAQDVSVIPNIITEVKLITKNIKGYAFYADNTMNQYNKGLIYLDVSDLDFSNSNSLNFGDYRGLFSSNFNLEKIVLPDFSIMTNVRKLYMFYGCTKLNTIKCNTACKDWLIANNSGNNIKLPSNITWEIVD